MDLGMYMAGIFTALSIFLGLKLIADSIKESARATRESNELLLRFGYKKELSFHDIETFLKAVRLSDIKLNINIDKNGVGYCFSKQKPYEHKKWVKTLDGMKEDGLILPSEVASLDSIMRSLLKETGHN